MACNGRTLLSDPQQTQVHSRLGHNSITDHITTDKPLMNASSIVFVHRTDVGSSDHYLKCFELGRTFDKKGKKQSTFLYKWRVDRLQDKVIRN